MKKISKKHLNQVLGKLGEIKEIPREHQNLVLERRKKTKENRERLLNWDEVSNNLAIKKISDRKARLNKVFGAIKLNEDAVKLQRRWRDEG